MLPVLQKSSCYYCVIFGFLQALTGNVSGQFLQSSYYLTTSSCYPGTAIGNVYAYGAYSYAISSSTGQFSISSTGTISPQTSLTSGTYTIYVTSYGSTTSTVPVQISASCNNNVINGYPITNNNGVFNQQSYYFTVTSCQAGTSIGSVYSSGASGYTISSSGLTGPFTISSTGLISAAGQLTSGVYSLQVTAFGSYSATLLVVVTVQCNGNSNNGNNWRNDRGRGRFDDRRRFG